MKSVELEEYCDDAIRNLSADHDAFFVAVNARAESHVGRACRWITYILDRDTGIGAFITYISLHPTHIIS